MRVAEIRNLVKICSLIGCSNKGASMRWMGVFVACVVLAASVASAAPLPENTPVRGWTILSNSEADDLATIAAAQHYNINHIQLSHEIVHNLREISDPKKLALINKLTDAAHNANVQE